MKIQERLRMQNKQKNKPVSKQRKQDWPVETNHMD